MLGPSWWKDLKEKLRPHKTINFSVAVQYKTLKCRFQKSGKQALVTQCISMAQCHTTHYVIFPSALQCCLALRWRPWWISRRLFASPDGSLINNSSCVEYVLSHFVFLALVFSHKMLIWSFFSHLLICGHFWDKDWWRKVSYYYFLSKTTHHLYFFLMMPDFWPFLLSTKTEIKDIKMKV